MNALLAWRVALFGAVALSFPVAGFTVFEWGTDRHATANVLSVVYAFGIPLAVSTAYWPLRCLQSWSAAQRLESLVLLYLGMSYVTHLSWELGWLVLHHAIIAHPDAFWTYTWWAYIDGGDARYAHPSGTLLALETLSVTNGAVGMAALWRYLASGRRGKTAVLVMAATAVVHLYSASFYYIGEILDGLPNVNTESFIGTYIKFGLANTPWVVFPWFAFRWARNKMNETSTSPTA